MTTNLKIVTIDQPSAFDIPAALRNLATDIENGDFGNPHNLAWIIDCGGGRIEIGVLGKVSELAPVAYWLFGLAKRKLENAAGIED